MNWNTFSLKYDKQKEWAFEQMSYLLFCAEHNNRIGLFRYKNQTGVETEPLVKDDLTIGFQSKYYTTSIAKNKNDIIDSIKKAKEKNKELDELYFYINLEFSESRSKDKKLPKYQQEIENTAEKLGLKLIWRVPSHFELQLSLPENKYIYDIFFNLNPNGVTLIDSIVAHNENILRDIQTEISFDRNKIKIDRKAIVGNINKLCREHKNIILSGEGGCGKTAIFKEFYTENAQAFPICIFKANELKVRNINDVFRFADNYTLQQFFEVYDEERVKIFVIDSAEKLAEISDFDVVNNLLRELTEHEWTIIFTTRYVYLNDLTFHIKETFHIPFEVCDVPLLSSDNLVSIAKDNEFILPSNSKFQDRLRNLFYLREYVSHYQNIDKQGNFKEFIEILWRKHIKGIITAGDLHIEREKCIIEIAKKRCESGRFYINVENQSRQALSMLKQDEILGYDDSYDGYFITHDIYEEWALGKIISRSFINRSNVKNFFETLGTSLPIRRAFRLWLSECLSDNPQEIDDFVKESLANNELDGFWTDELWVSILLSNTSSSFFNRFENEIVKDNYKLLKKILFLLRIACVDTSVNLGYETPIPKGGGWAEAISLAYKYKEDFAFNNIYHILPVLTDWCNSNKVGETTHKAGLLALSIIQQTETKENFYFHDDLEEKILKIVFDAAGEVKKELKDIFDRVVANRWVKHRNPYEGLCTKILEKPYLALEVIKVLPISVIQVCDLFWQDNRDEDDYEYARTELKHEYGLTESYDFDYFPASANQTPVKWLLQAAFKETLDFIIVFTNKAVEKYKQSDYGRNDVAEITLHIGGVEVKQYISNAIWGMHRGIIGPAVPYLLQSIHMALEKFLLEIAQSCDPNIVKNILLSILLDSKSASLTSVVCSVVLAYSEKFSDIALILFRTIELFHYDSTRHLNENQAKSLYSIGYGLNKLKDALYTDKRLKTCEDKFRQTCLEIIFLNYQYFGVNGFSEKQNAELINSIYNILDNHKANESIRTQYGILLARMDRRNLTTKVSEHKEGSLLIEFTPKELNEKLNKKSEENVSAYEEMFKYSSLRMWSDFLHNQSAKQTEYDNKPLLALAEAKQLLEEISNADTNAGWNYSIPSYVCSKLLIEYLDKLSADDKAFCKEVVMTTISNLFNDNYAYQLGDGVEAACHALPVLMSEYPAEIDDYIVCVVFILFDEQELGAYKRICDYIIESIHKSNMWEKNDKAVQAILRGYVKLKPIYHSIISDLKAEQGYWGHISKQTVLTELANREIDITFTDLEYDKENVENLDIFDLEKVLLLIPSETTNEEYKGIIDIAIQKCASELFCDRHKRASNNAVNRNIYSVRRNMFKQITRFLLNRELLEIDRYIMPILSSLQATEETASFIEEMILAEDDMCKREQFWYIWMQMYPYIKSLCLRPKDYYLKNVMTNYLLAWRWWRDDADSWHSLTIDNLSFYNMVSEELSHVPAVLYSISRILCTIGCKFKKDGVEWLYAIVSKNKALVLDDLESNTLFYIEHYLRKYVFENRENIKKDFRLKSKIIEILGFAIERGSMRSYQLRESIL